MNKQLLISGCLVFLFPWTASAAQETCLAPSFLAVPLSMLFFVALVAGWLYRQLSKSKTQYTEVIDQSRVHAEMVEQSPWPAILIDEQLKIVLANREARDCFNPQQLLGGAFPELLPGEAAHPLLHVLKSGKNKAEKTDSVVGVEGATLRLVTINGQRYGLWFGPPQVEQCAQASEAFLSQAEESANRMKSEFIANINHEVRTPMNAIIGYTEMLANSPLGSKEKRFVETIHKSSMALVSIFNDIMELSKIDSGRLQIMTSSIRLDSLVREVEGLYCDQAMEKGIRLECRMENHLPNSFILDGVRLKQVLHNLISNAIKFTSEGQVHLVVDGIPSSGQSNCYDLSFTVEDTGIGIPKTDQQKIFEVFRQREDTIAKRYGGVGLGLTLCSRLVTMMGGRIDLFSAAGEGSRFTVLLNNIALAESPPAQKLAADQPKARNHRQALTLLVVDDVDLIKDVFIDFFQGSPHKVVTANTGEEALGLARSVQPDIIFMDLNLSGMDGRTVTEKIREEKELSNIPVVVMTGEILEEEDYRPLFDDFLQKPFRLELLMEVIDKYGKQSSVNTGHGGRDGGDQEGDDAHFSSSVQAAWDDELDQLLRQAVRSGSLSDAAALGAAIGKEGEGRKDGLLMSLGGDLLQFAAEPNIMGVDRLLAKLSRVVNRKDV
ncbi:MAG: ATP-binding protein [Desulfobulbus sp.]|nr:ATP-binding protein [Desulfobulbus sp.]